MVIVTINSFIKSQGYLCKHHMVQDVGILWLYNSILITKYEFIAGEFV